jgi:cell division protein FtsB
MSELPENRKPLLWRDMPFADRPKAHPSTERLEIEKLKERVAELEARIAKVREETLREALDAAREYRYRRGEAVENAILALIEKDAE